MAPFESRESIDTVHSAVSFENRGLVRRAQSAALKGCLKITLVGGKFSDIVRTS